MSDELEHDDSEFEIDDPYWDFDDDDDYWDEDEDDYYDDQDDEDYHYECPVCGAEDEEPCNEAVHARHDEAEAGLNPQLQACKCWIDGGSLKFRRYKSANDLCLQQYAIAWCDECYEAYMVLHAPDFKIIAVYPGYGDIYTGVASDQVPYEHDDGDVIPF